MRSNPSQTYSEQRSILEHIKAWFANNTAAGAFVVIVFIFLILAVFSIVYGALDMAYSEVSNNISVVSGLNTSSPYYQDPGAGKSYVDMIWFSVLLIIFIAGAVWSFAQVQT